MIVIKMFCTHLDSGLGQVGPGGKPLPGRHAGVMRVLELLLQLVQLFRGEGRPVAPELGRVRVEHVTVLVMLAMVVLGGETEVHPCCGRGNEARVVRRQGRRWG